MSKVRIISTVEGRCGQTMNLPIIGEVTIPDDGILEVEEEVAQLLVENSPSWVYVDEPAEEEDEDEDEDEGEEGGEEEDDQDSSEINDLGEGEEEGSNEEISTEDKEKLASKLKRVSAEKLVEFMKSEGYEIPDDHQYTKSSLIETLMNEYGDLSKKGKKKLNKLG